MGLSAFPVNFCVVHYIGGNSIFNNIKFLVDEKEFIIPQTGQIINHHHRFQAIIPIGVEGP